MAPTDSDQSAGYQQKAWYYPTFSCGAQTAKPRVCLLPRGTLVDLTRRIDEEDNEDDDDYGDDDEDDNGDGDDDEEDNGDGVCKAYTKADKRY